MSCHDTPRSDATPVATVDQAGIIGLENIAALAEDMMNRGMTAASASLEEMAQARLGPNATPEDAKALLASLKSILDA